MVRPRHGAPYEPMSPTLSDLCVMGERMDVIVRQEDLEPGVLGFYAPDEARVYLSRRLTPIEMRSTLAHELAHVHFGHDCERPEWERQAWRWAANVLVHPSDYARLEREGLHLDAIADELHVTRSIIDAFREHHLQRLGDRAYGRRISGRFTNALANRLAP